MNTDRHYFVYILADRIGGRTYVGVTNDIFRRIPEHKAGDGATYTKEHGIDRLVYYETHTDISAAIAREKRIKRWRRSFKVALIEAENPNWVDLYPRLLP